VGRKNTEPLGSMLPLPLQFLAAWLGVCFALLRTKTLFTSCSQLRHS
jgi:hypothetical protein